MLVIWYILKESSVIGTPLLIFLVSLLLLLLQSATGGSNQHILAAAVQAQHREQQEWTRTSTSHILHSNSSCDVSIFTSTRGNPGSPLLSFRGEIVSKPVHISDAVAHFKDLNLRYDYIDMLKEIRDLGPISQGSEIHIVYQCVSLPWPVSDRELILEVAFTPPHLISSHLPSPQPTYPILVSASLAGSFTTQDCQCQLLLSRGYSS